MSKKVSVIVPIYNAAPYLTKCLDSIVNQTYKNLEIILVNDGSTDNSVEIIDQYAQQDDRIVVVTQENKGLGSAWNSGIDRATGDLISFVDSDDWLELTAYEECVGLQEEYDCDLVSYGWMECDDNGNRVPGKTPTCTDEILITDKDEMIRRYMQRDGIYVATWGKLSKKEMFDDLRFAGGHLLSGDVLPSYILVNKANSVYVHSKKIHYVYSRPNSLSRSGYNKNSIGTFRYVSEVYNRISTDHPALKYENEVFAFEFISDLYDKMVRANYTGSDYDEIVSWISNHKENFAHNPYFSWKRKIRIWLICHQLDKIPSKIYMKCKNLIAQN